MKNQFDQYRIKPGEKVDLAGYDASVPEKWEGRKGEGIEEFESLRQRLGELQEILYAEHKQKLLVVFQAMDTGGKDGTIQAVLEGVNPQGVHVASFKAPTLLELDHDYLWRIHAHTPGKGMISIFNRSHYEDVLVVRVHNLVRESVWRKRFEHIRQFEKVLADEGTTIVKFYLHIDMEEQAQRLLERIDTPEKRWKFNPSDLDERKLWKDYMRAFEDALAETSTTYAPWYAVPANANWFRNLVVAGVLVGCLEDLKMEYPSPVENIGQYRAGLEEQIS